MPAPSGERATLSRDLADFLIEFSIALHKHAMYPEGHPSLAPAAAGVTRRAALLLEDRATLSLGVARQQLGLGPLERLRAWAGVQLHPLTYERLELVDDGAPASERGARAAQLWV